MFAVLSFLETQFGKRLLASPKVALADFPFRMSVTHADDVVVMPFVRFFFSPVSC